DGYLKNPSTYEIISPASVGVPETRLVLGKHSGRHALNQRAKDLGFDLNREELDELYRRFTLLADNKKGVRNEEILKLIVEVTNRNPALETAQAITAH
ncbi:MAG: homocitrate synthase/isopropylmalate synthase family protein, partial [Bryobacteraceae bacterium]